MKLSESIKSANCLRPIPPSMPGYKAIHHSTLNAWAASAAELEQELAVRDLALRNLSLAWAVHPASTNFVLTNNPQYNARAAAILAKWMAEAHEEADRETSADPTQAD